VRQLDSRQRRVAIDRTPTASGSHALPHPSLLSFGPVRIPQDQQDGDAA